MYRALRDGGFARHAVSHEGRHGGSCRRAISAGTDMQEHGRERQRVSITREHVRQMGVTVGCRGCKAVNLGLRAENHSEVCRRRFEASMRASGDPKLARAEQRLKRGCTA